MALRQLRSALHAFTREAAWQLARMSGANCPSACRNTPARNTNMPLFQRKRPLSTYA